MRARTVLATAVAAGCGIAGSVLPAFAHDPSAPVVDALDLVKAAHGFAFRATTSGDVNRVDFVVDFVRPDRGYGPDVTTAVTARSADGGWQTMSPLDLPYGRYLLRAQAFAADGSSSGPWAGAGTPAVRYRPRGWSHGVLIHFGSTDTATSPPASAASPTTSSTGHWTC
jgi:hypothetical protein